MPRDYVGLAIEAVALEDPDIYHPNNDSLIALTRRLSPNGVLRIGGNTSDYCWWRDTPDAAPPAQGRLPAGKVQRETWHALTPQAVDNLAGFLKATGWTAIWGLNFGTAETGDMVREATYVARALGPSLRYLQIGNEPDFYGRPGVGFRNADWSFDAYLAQWLAVADAISAAVPGARFGAPDAGARADWVVAMADEGKAKAGSRLVELTSHYYVAGADSPDAIPATLLNHDPTIDHAMNTIIPAARRAGLPYRMTEGNSFYRGGRAGASDAFVSALWGADYMLAMAARGCAGINLQGGSGHEIATALGGRLPGARDAKDLEAAQLGSFYAPIAGSRAAGYAARPLFYGIMVAQAFAGTRLVDTTLSAGRLNATAYAGSGPDGWRIAILNKEPDWDLEVTIPIAHLGIGAAEIRRLAAPSFTAQSGVVLGGASVANGDAAWAPHDETVQAGDDTLTLTVPHASGALLLARA